MHVRIEIGEATSREGCHRALVKVISHPNLECPRDDGDVFPLGMPMGRDAVSIGHLQAHSVISARGAWVPLKYRELRAWGHERRCRTVRNRIGRERMFFRSSGPSAKCQD